MQTPTLSKASDIFVGPKAGWGHAAYLFVGASVHSPLLWEVGGLATQKTCKLQVRQAGGWESAASVPADSLQNPRHSQTGEGRTVMPVPAQDLNRMIQPSWQNRTIFDNVIFSSTKSYDFGVAKRKNITFPSFHIKFSHCLIHASNAN